jgi:predicted negative regulator of RcsB-dependent stress response
LGGGDIAHFVANFESSSAELDRLMRAKKSMEAEELEKSEAVLGSTVELVQVFMEATLSYLTPTS